MDLSNSKYQISIQSGYVLVEDPPDYEVVLSEQSAKLQAISNACSEVGYRKVLIRGTRATSNLTVTDFYEFGNEVARIKMQIAIVTSLNASKADLKFFENVATNRGSPLRFFDDEQDAKDWLGV